MLNLTFTHLLKINLPFSEDVTTTRRIARVKLDFRIISIRQKRPIFLRKPRDFDGVLGIGLPVSMYTTKTPIDMCRFNVTRLNELFTFSVKDRYQLNIVFVSKTSMHRQ